jgi:hypothetical protein
VKERVAELLQQVIQQREEAARVVERCNGAINVLSQLHAEAEQGATTQVQPEGASQAGLAR